MTDEDWAMCSYDGTIKLSGLVWYYLHHIRYVTDESLTADTAGEVALRGFKGDYDITVSYGGKEYPIEYTLLSNQTAAVVMLDDVNIASALYADWLEEFPILGSYTNPLDNIDGDGWNNGVEYALGGNPGVPDSSVLSQTLESGGTNFVEYVYSRRIDAAARGLSYQLFHTTNLIGSAWMTNRFEFGGAGALNSDFESVTNRISTEAESQQFIKLQVERL